MSSFRPYKKSEVSVIRSTENCEETCEEKEQEEEQEKPSSKRVEIIWMERVLPSGEIVKLPVMEEGAVATLMGNGFRKSYPKPNEIASLPPDQVHTSHVIVRPQPVFPELQNLSPFALASFICPDYQPTNQNGGESERKRRGPPKKVSSAVNSRKYAKGASRGRFPKLAQQTVLEQMMKDAEEYSKRLAAQVNFSIAQVPKFP